MDWRVMAKYLELNAKVTVKSDGKMGDRKDKSDKSNVKTS